MVTELMKDIYRIEVPLPKNPMKLLILISSAATAGVW